MRGMGMPPIGWPISFFNFGIFITGLQIDVFPNEVLLCILLASMMHSFSELLKRAMPAPFMSATFSMIVLNRRSEEA